VTASDADAIGIRVGESHRAHHADNFREDLTELLAEIGALLSADTAVLLVADNGGTTLTPAASSGIAIGPDVQQCAFLLVGGSPGGSPRPGSR
jgi:hypothetical protein